MTGLKLFQILLDTLLKACEEYQPLTCNAEMESSNGISKIWNHRDKIQLRLRFEKYNDEVARWYRAVSINHHNHYSYTLYLFHRHRHIIIMLQK